MEYRAFGDLKVSAFGFGAMRMPVIDNNQEKIDEAEAIKMIRYAIDNGVNYFDTAYVYHGGNSEGLLGKALRDGYREKIFLTTKLPTWLVKSEDDVFKYLDEELVRLQTDYLDFYLVHCLDTKLFDIVKNCNIIKQLEKAKEMGKIRHIGFSFHDELPVFKEIVDYYDWEICQIQLNILDENYQAGLQGLEYAKSKNIPVIIMEPVKGGTLANNVPQEVLDLYGNYKKKFSSVEWAFKFVSNFEGVLTILSGVSNMEQLKDNIRIFSNTSPGSLTKEDLEIIEKVKQIYFSKIKVGCTGCNYCMPCPSEVKIPSVFQIYNNSSMFDYEKYKPEYVKLKSQGKTDCVECGACEALCPQSIPIIEKLKEAAEYFCN